MLFVAGLLGAIFGALLEGWTGAWVGAVLGPLLAQYFRRRRQLRADGVVARPTAGDDETIAVDPPASAAHTGSLQFRVLALEREVSALRLQVQALSRSGAAAATATSADPTAAAAAAADLTATRQTAADTAGEAAPQAVAEAAQHTLPPAAAAAGPAGALAIDERVEDAARAHLDARPPAAAAPLPVSPRTDVGAAAATSAAAPSFATALAAAPIEPGSLPTDASAAAPMLGARDAAALPSPQAEHAADALHAIEDGAWQAPSARSRPAAPPPPVRPPRPPLRDRLPPFMSRWVFGGNPLVKVGVLILFLGLAFLLRYAAERVSVPVELRYAGVGLVGAVLLVLGWRLRARADNYGLILQGAGIGVFYLTVLAAIKLHPLLPVSLAFAFMVGVATFGAVLAVVQNAPWLALVSAAEGFAAPVLVSTGGGSHVALFSYLAILDFGVFLMAWFKAWRPLNLVSAVATFALASGWAASHYEPSRYASVQAFLLLFFLLFTAIGVLFARRALASGSGDAADDQPLAERAGAALRQVGRVDSTLAFGVPLAAFSLQYLLVREMPWGPAQSAFGFAFFYLLLGGALLRNRNPRYALLGEAYVIVSVIFGTLTIPLALEGVWTGATWAIEAAGMYWLGVRQQRAYARAFALLVMAAALVRLFAELRIDTGAATPLIVGPVLGVALAAAAAAAMTWLQRRLPADQQTRIDAAQGTAMPVVVVGSMALLAWMLVTPTWAGVASAWLGFAAAAGAVRLGRPVLRPCAAALHGVALASIGLSLHTVEGAAMLASGWRGLAASALVAAALLATAWLPLRQALRQGTATDAGAQAPVASSSTAALMLGLALVCLSLLFVLPADRAALAWVWIGIVCVALAHRLGHSPLAAAGLALQAIAGVATLVYGPTLSRWAAPPPGGVPWGPLMLTLAGGVAADFARRIGAMPRPSVPALAKPQMQWGLVAWTLGWWGALLPPLALRHLQLHDQQALWPNVQVAWVLLSAALMLALAHWRRWRVMGQATWACVPLWVLIAADALTASPRPPSADGGWLVWPLALLAHLPLLRRQGAWMPPPLLTPLHVLGFWLFVMLGAVECQHWLQQAGAAGSAWGTLGWMIVPAAALAAIASPRVLARWPLTAFREAYLLIACAPLALYLLAWLWIGNGASGNAAPLPYVPVLNPLELGQLLVLLALFLWWRAWPATAAQRLPRPLAVGGLGLTAFMLYTGLVLRISHHWGGVPWDASSLFHSTSTQAGLSVAWALVGVCAMLFGHRSARRSAWIVGAALLGIVVAKLFLIELADRGGLYRIVSFIVVGILLLLVGYFAPVPPKNPQAADKEKAFV